MGPPRGIARACGWARRPKVPEFQKILKSVAKIFFRYISQKNQKIGDIYEN